jgi:very-short-patch-repair endonuclease
MEASPLSRQRARDLRKRMSPAEAVLWRCLRNQQLEGLKFRRQHPFGPYVLDFYCDGAGLAVEVDGLAHGEEAQRAHDLKRDAWLKSQGVRTLRVEAEWVRMDLRGLLKRIAEVARGG